MSGEVDAVEIADHLAVDDHFPVRVDLEVGDARDRALVAEEVDAVEGLDELSSSQVWMAARDSAQMLTP